MSDSPVYIASDVHLGAVPDEVEDAFISWLEFAAGRSRRIILNGDLFDFWFEFRTGIPAGYERTLSALREVVSSGVRIDFLGGNHDWWGGRYLTDEIGLQLHHRPQRWTLAGYRCWIGHGDGEGPGDYGYKMLSAVIRNPLFVAAFRQLPISWGDRIAGRVSSTTGRWRAPDAEEIASNARLERWATGHLVENDLDIVSTGHTHLPRVSEVESGRWYLNSGDWVWHRSYLRLTTGEPPALFGWEGGALDEREPR